MTPLDLSSFHQFRQRLHRGGQWSNYWTPDKSYTDDKTGQKKTSKRTLWFPTGQTPPVPASWGGNIYFGVHPNQQRNEDWQRSRNDEIAAINCVFAEVDGKDMVTVTEADIAEAMPGVMAADAERVARDGGRPNPPKTLRNLATAAARNAIFKRDIPHYNELAHHHVMGLDPQPSVIIFSGGGWHLYWFLAVPFLINTDADRKRAKELQARWVDFVGGDGGAKDLARVLRVPGTKNVKPKYAPDFPTIEFVKLDYSIEYTIGQLEALLPAIVKPTKPRSMARSDKPATIGSTGTEAGAETQKAPRRGNSIIDAYDAAHTIGEMCERYGYPKAGDRYMRPGGEDSPGVAPTADNRAFIHSSSDPMYNEAMRPVSPFDFLKVWEHDGDFGAALEAAAAELGMYTPNQARALVDAAQDYLLTQDIGQHVPAELKASGGAQYRTRATDTLIGSRILDIMHLAGRVTDVTINAYQVVRTTDSHGSRTEIASHKTVANVLSRMIWLFDATPTDKPNTWLVSLKVDIVTFPPSSIETEKLFTGKVLTSTFYTYKADDQYSSRTSAVVRDALRAEALAERDPGEDDGAVTDRYRAKLNELYPGLGVMAIPVIETLASHPGVGATTNELAAEFGLSVGTVNGILRKLRAIGLVESMRQYKQPSLHFIYDEPFQQIDERAHEFRTYNAGINRLAKSLEKAQTWAEKQMGLARATGENTEAIERRHNHIIKQRRATLSALHPTWTPEDTNRWVYAQRPTETPYLDIKEQQRNAAERMAERDATRQTMMQAAKGLRDQGIKGRDAIRMLELAEWTPQEAQQILSWA